MTTSLCNDSFDEQPGGDDRYWEGPAIDTRPAIETASGTLIYIDEIEGGVKAGGVLRWEWEEGVEQVQRVFVNGEERRIVRRN